MMRISYALLVSLVVTTLLLSSLPGQARRMLTDPNDTVESARTEAQQALQASNMQVTISTVGFDIGAGSEAELYLQQVAQIGSGGYFTASDSGQLTAAMGAAASGQTGMATQGSVTITSPQDGDIAGPATEIIGHTDPEALVVIWTVIYNKDTGEKLRNVPGIRHKAKANGDFHFRIATPRVAFGEREMPVRYEIHAQVVTPNFKGPETIINLYSE